jgi:hypothetical protein
MRLTINSDHFPEQNYLIVFKWKIGVFCELENEYLCVI